MTRKGLRLRWLLAGALVLVVLAGLAASVPAVLGPAVLAGQLGRAGFPEAEADVLGYDWRGAVLGLDLDGGGPLEPGIVRVSWSAGGLRKRELDRVEVEGLGLRFDAGARPQGGDGPLVPRMPVGELVLRDLAVRFPVGGGERDYRVSGHLLRTGSGVRLRAQAAGRAEVLHLDVAGTAGAAGIGAVAGGFRLELADLAVADMRLSARAEGRLDFDGTVLGLRDGRLHVETPDGGVAEIGAGRIRAAPGDGGWRLSAEEVSASASGLRIGGVGISVPGMTVSLDGGLDAGEVRMDGVVAIDGAPVEGVNLAQARLALRGALRWDGDTWAFHPAGCQTVTASRVSIGSDGLGTVLDACVQAGASGPALSLGPDGIAAGLVVRPGPLRIGPPARSEGPRLDVTIPELRLAVEADRGGAVRRLDLDSAGLSAALPDRGMAIDALAVSARYRPREPVPLAVGLQANAIGSAQGSALTGPVALDLRATGAAGGGLDFDGELSGALPGLVAGTFELGSGRGELRIEGREMPFGPGAASLDAVSPLLAESVRDLEGTARLRARMAWGPDGPSAGTGELLLRDMAFTIGPVAVQGLNTVLRARSLAPLVLDPGQAVGIGLLDVGIPLTNGQVLFGFGPGEHVAVQDASWSWAGGIVRASPFRVSPRTLAADVVLDARDMDLGKLLQLLPIEGVSGTGTVSGRIPVEVRGDAVTVRGGRLAATGPGSLRYRPDEPPAGFDAQGGTEMLLQALTDFRYDSLVLHLDGTAGGELSARLSVRGANPDFYDGYPVALNLNVSGALDTILRQGIRTYRIPDAVRERMLEFEARGG